MSGEAKGRTPFSLVHASITVSGLDHGCHRLYTFLDLKIGPRQEWIVAGAVDIGEQINMQGRTVLEHARHLTDAGLIDFYREGQSKVHFLLLHNPARGLTGELEAIPPIKPHYRKPSKAETRFPRKGLDDPTRKSRDTSLGDPTRKSRDTGRDKRGSTAPARPAESAGRSKSAEKYEGLYASDARAIVDEELCAFPGCSEAIEGHSFLHEPVRPRVPVTAEDAIEFSEFDPDGEVVDASEDTLGQAPWTVAPPYDDDDLARLFADEPGTEDQSLASNPEGEPVGMNVEEAVAAILRAFPGAELVDEEMLGEHGAKPIANLYHCFYCGDPVTPGPVSVEHGWSTVCRPCSEAGR
jgi:DNA-binding transcriptional ArsR family regulator